MIKEDLVYLVSIVNVDTHDVRYVCDSETKAMEMFEELRKECIEECEEAIQYCCCESGNMSCVPHEQEKIAFLKSMKCGDVPLWSCDRPTIEVFPFLQSTRDIPTSKELISFANTEWENREERKGYTEANRSFWTSGWISGFLTPAKPNWDKEREEKVRKEEREKIRAVLCLHPADEYCIGEMNSEDCLTYEGGCTVCKFDHAVKEKPKFTYEENGNDR